MPLVTPPPDSRSTSLPSRYTIRQAGREVGCTLPCSESGTDSTQPISSVKQWLHAEGEPWLAIFLYCFFLTPPFRYLLLSLSPSFCATGTFRVWQHTTLCMGQTERCLASSQNPALLSRGRESRARLRGYSSCKRWMEAVKHVREPYLDAAVTGEWLLILGGAAGSLMHTDL